MIPGWWQFVLLSLAAFRLTRLIGWDDLPPVAKARRWAIGEKVWMKPNSDIDDETWVEYDRPLLAHFVHCPFCVGAWLSLVVVGCWWLSPHWTLAACVPLAVSTVVGLTAKQLDA